MQKRLAIKIPIEGFYILDISIEELYDWLNEYYSSESDRTYLSGVLQIIKGSLTRLKDDKFISPFDDEYLGKLLYKYFNNKGFADISTKSENDITDVQVNRDYYSYKPLNYDIECYDLYQPEEVRVGINQVMSHKEREQWLKDNLII